MVWQKLAGAFLFSLLAACAPTSTPPTIVPANHNHFDGIAQLARNATPAHQLHILIIHGMGTDSDSFFNGFIAQTAARLGLVQVEYVGPPPALGTVAMPSPTPVPVPSPLPAHTSPALLYNFNFAHSSNEAPSVVFTYLLWAPLTAQIKDRRLAEGGHPPWQVVSSYAKEFIREGLGDVVLYGGTYGADVMRPAVEAALCEFVGGTPSPDLGGTPPIHPPRCSGAQEGTTTVVVTHSLGGYILMDAIDDEISKEEAANIAKHRRPAYQSPAAEIVRNTRYIYMLANQLPLLDLIQYNSDPNVISDPNCTPPERGQTQTFPHRTLDKFSCNWEKVRGTQAPNLQLVAFSDPNDILSYLISRADIGLPAGSSEAPHRRYNNTYVENGEFDIPYLYSDVFGAHLDYVSNPMVLDLFVCGMENGAVKPPCPPPH